MKRVYLDFHHAEFEDLSDRSIRQFMKKVGTAVKEAQLRELSDFIFSLDLDYSLKRSMLDRLTSGSETAPSYYVEVIKRGSLTASFLVSLVLIGKLLHEPVIGMIDDEQKRKEVLRGLKRHLKRRCERSLAQNVAEQLSGRKLGSHLVVDKIDVKEKRSKIVVGVKLETVLDEDAPPRRVGDTPETLDREIERQLDSLGKDRN